MVTDQLCSVGWRSPPGSFVSLMTLYESNYIRLGWIVSDVRRLDGRHVSRIADDVSLHLEVIEHSRYTTLLKLSYRFDGHDPAGTGGERPIPDMQIRVYHDARLVEACSCVDLPAQVPSAPQLDRRWTRNMLLNKWLEYCAERGYRFPDAR